MDYKEYLEKQSIVQYKPNGDVTEPVIQDQNKTVNIIMPEQKPPNIHEHITQEVALTMRDQTVTALQDEQLRDKMKKAATTVIEKKVDTVVNQVTGENNESASELEEEALSCFGYKSGKSIRRWQTKWASWYHSGLSAIWMAIAMFTFAPIVFVAKKVSVGAKVSKWGIGLGILIYVMVMLAIILPATL